MGLPWRGSDEGRPRTPLLTQRLSVNPVHLRHCLHARPQLDLDQIFPLPRNLSGETRREIYKLLCNLDANYDQ